MSGSIEIFLCYARKDQQLLDKLKIHLMPLQRTGLIRMWYDADISPGTNWEEEIHKHLNTADLILLLVSPDFITSEYCYSIEMIQAMERHERQEVQVIPIILRPIHRQKTPFGMLQALPTDAIPVISRTWYDLDEALYNVAEGIRKAVEELILAKRFASISQRAKQALASLVEVVIWLNDRTKILG